MAEARGILDLLDQGSTTALTPLLAPRLEGWDADSWIRDQWVAGLESILGPRRRVVSETQVSSTLTRFHLEGERGTAVATIILDDAGRWFGASLKRRAAEGIANIVLQCPWNRERDAMSALYDNLLHLDRWDVPTLVFDEGMPDDPRPRWPDPAYPQQMHLDIRVGDLDAVDALVVNRGATRLARFDGPPATRPLAARSRRASCWLLEGARCIVAKRRDTAANAVDRLRSIGGGVVLERIRIGDLSTPVVVLAARPSSSHGRADQLGPEPRPRGGTDRR